MTNYSKLMSKYWRFRRLLRELPRMPHRRIQAMRARHNRSIVEIIGVKFRLQSFFSLHLCENILRERYETEERALLIKWLEPEDIVMELGTGLGFLATLCALRIGSDRVYTFEANPNLSNVIEETFSLNSVNPHFETLMLGPEKGIAKFYLGQEFNASSNQRTSAAIQTIEVPMESFNERVREIEPSVLICDIEGGECELFEYAEVPTVRKLLIELHPTKIGIEKIRETVETIKAAGFNREDGSDKVMLFRRDAG